MGNNEEINRLNEKIRHQAQMIESLEIGTLVLHNKVSFLEAKIKSSDFVHRTLYDLYKRLRDKKIGVQDEEYLAAP